MAMKFRTEADRAAYVARRHQAPAHVPASRSAPSLQQWLRTRLPEHTQAIDDPRFAWVLAALESGLVAHVVNGEPFEFAVGRTYEDVQ